MHDKGLKVMRINDSMEGFGEKMERTFTVIDEAGIHARPASVLVSTANKFQADISLEHRGKTVNLKSILGVMSLGICANDEFTIRTDGVDAEEALTDLQSMLESKGLAE